MGDRALTLGDCHPTLGLCHFCAILYDFIQTCSINNSNSLFHTSISGRFAQNENYQLDTMVFHSCSCDCAFNFQLARNLGLLSFKFALWNFLLHCKGNFQKKPWHGRCVFWAFPGDVAGTKAASNLRVGGICSCTCGDEAQGW